MEQPKQIQINPSHKRSLLYIFAIVFSMVAYFSLQAVFAQPQPLVQIVYNSIAQAGTGQIINTLSYPINITYIYCTAPNGTKYEFKNPPETSLQPGSKTSVSILTSNSQTSMPVSCVNWRVSYVLGGRNTPSYNTSSNPVVIVQNRSG